MNFDHLDKLALKAEKTARFHFAVESGSPLDGAYLDVLPATEENKPYWNAAFRQEQGLSRMSRKGVTAAVYAKRRELEVGLFAEHVVRGWGGIRDGRGAEVAFSKDACRELLDKLRTALPDVFDEIRAFCNDRGNWRPDAVDAEEAAKNS